MLTTDVINVYIPEDGVREEPDEGLCGNLVLPIESRSISFSFRRAPAAANFVSMLLCWMSFRPKTTLSPIDAERAVPSAVIVMLHAKWSMVRCQ